MVLSRHLVVTALLHLLYTTNSFTTRPLQKLAVTFRQSPALYAEPKDSENEDEPVDPKVSSARDENAKKKQELVKAVGQQIRDARQGDTVEKKPTGIFDKLNPFKAGQNLRKTLDSAFTGITTVGGNTPVSSIEKESMYYLDDLMLEMSSEYNPSVSFLQDRLNNDEFVPEVLVVGATGQVGQLVVRRLLQQNRFRVRVLVRDLYSKTLNALGTGVTYCQGDLQNLDSLEYALTDVDKIVFCASAPSSDEEQFKQKFREYTQDTLVSDTNNATDITVTKEKARYNKNGQLISSPLLLLPSSEKSDQEWEQLESVLAVRAQLAEQVDCVGMQNLIRAYQHVRHADYGTSQSAKRTLFKFGGGRKDDFNLFAISNDDDDDIKDDATSKSKTKNEKPKEYDDYDEDDYSTDNYANYDDYEDTYDDYYGGAESGQQRLAAKAQVQWMRNKFEHAVFVGRLSKTGEASIISTRFRSREQPDNGIDLSLGFAGFIARVCSDGGVYEAFIRTREYYENGIEYVCQFSTETKMSTPRNKSSNKFVTVRLPFENFKPVSNKKDKKIGSVTEFSGQDVRNIGFRYRTSSNELKTKLSTEDTTSFYLALSYIKLYRSQPEPEFVYLSDARIPPVVRNDMVRHDARQLLDGPEFTIFDENTFQTAGRSPEETYYKYRGEDILKKSGLSYAIVRVIGFNEQLSGDASSIELKSGIDSNEKEFVPVSRAEAAQVCVSALLDPNALNKSFYLSKKVGGGINDEDISSKFVSLSADAVV